MASIVDMDLKAATSNASRRFTIFAPNDSYIMSMPKYGKDRLFNASSWALLKSVSTYHIKIISSFKQVLLDFSLTVKAATLIFISGRGSAISSAKEGKSGFIYNLVKS